MAIAAQVARVAGGFAEAWPTGALPDPLEVAEGITAIPARMLPGFIPFSVAYLVEADDGPHLLDTGWRGKSAWQDLCAGIEIAGRTPEEIRSVTVTHLHPDHAGLVERFTELGADFYSGSDEAEAQSVLDKLRPSIERAVSGWGVPEDRVTETLVDADRAKFEEAPPVGYRLADGDPLPWAGRNATALLTPGHTHGHICVRVDGDEVFFTGDHVLPTLNPGIGLGAPMENPVADTLASLARVAAIDTGSTLGLPGHAYPFIGLAERCASITRHHLRRSAEVAEVLEQHPDATVWDAASRLTWTAGWDRLRGGLLSSALAQAQMHMRFLETAE